MKAFFIFISVIVLFAIVSWVLLSFVLVSDEQKIRWVIEKGRHGIQSGSLLTFSHILAADYQDSSGMDRAMLLSTLQSLFHEARNRRLLILKESIRVHENRAEADIEFVLQADLDHSQLSRALAGSRNDARSLRVYLTKEGRQWVISRTEHAKP